jgi:hypothetical protein
VIKITDIRDIRERKGKTGIRKGIRKDKKVK